MNKNWLKNCTAAGFALALMAAPAAAQDAGFGDWDANSDAGINQEEFNTGFGENGAFENWDADDSGGLSEDEYNAGVTAAGDDYTERFGENAYGEWDADDNNELSEDEFNEGVYGAYDADDSGTIEEPEFGDLNDDMGDGGFWDV